MRRRDGARFTLASLLMAALVGAPDASMAQDDAPAGYDALVALFDDWRAFERPPLRDGAPDYTAERMAAAHAELPAYRARLEAIDPSGWPIEHQIDWHLVRAELNGFDFNAQVLRPWARDPAFYQSVWTGQSDTPAHEGPTHHALLELWTYDFPLSDAEEARLIGDLRVIPPLLEQARANLTGNARDLWVGGIRTMGNQIADLDALARTLGEDADEELASTVAAARGATENFVAWLEKEAPSKTGPSGIGRDNYTWYLRNVHLVPLTWEEEVALLKRELDRAWASLRLEEQRNRDLPPLVAADSKEEYDRRADEAARKFIRFLEESGAVHVRPYHETALREHLGSFVPAEERNFFRIAQHFDPRTLYAHWYHWFDHARVVEQPHPSPIRRGPLLYNIWDSRSEGQATGFEEMMLHAGMFDDNPRAREIIWIMLAQRAARGLGNLYAHDNTMTMREAAEFHVRWTPRGWMKEDDLLAFEQHFYMRQPGYGASYVTGKVLIERMMAERSAQVGDESFRLADFFEEMDAVGLVPVSLIRWQLTGQDDEIEALMAKYEPL